jgi:hypothetical protein
VQSLPDYFLKKVQQYIRTNEINLKLRVEMQNEGKGLLISDKVQRGITRYSGDFGFKKWREDINVSVALAFIDK